MPTNKPQKPDTTQQPKAKKSTEMGDDELKTVSGGLASTGGITISDPTTCVSRF